MLHLKSECLKLKVSKVTKVKDQQKFCGHFNQILGILAHFRHFSHLL